MLMVRIELHHAKTHKVSEIAALTIGNVGGLEELGNYVVRLQAPPPSTPLGVRFPARVGMVHGHARLTEPVWSLVAKALKSVGFEP